MSPWKVILATMVIFVCGVITGAMVTRAPLPAAVAAEAAPAGEKAKNPPPYFGQLQRPEFLKRMEKQLELTAAQRDEISRIMKESHERTKPLWDQIAPQMGAELKKVRQDITAVLTPEQRTKFAELLKHGHKPDAAAPGNSRPAPASSEAATNGI